MAERTDRGTARRSADPAIAASLRRERERAGLSLTELARRAHVAKSTLSQLESGTGNPSVETLWALGVALDVPFSRLVEPPRQAVRVVRAGEGPVTRSERSTYAATLLSSSPPHARRDVYRITAEPGEPRLSEPHMPGTIEHAGGRRGAGPGRAGRRPGRAGPGRLRHLSRRRAARVRGARGRGRRP